MKKMTVSNRVLALGSAFTLMLLALAGCPDDSTQEQPTPLAQVDEPEEMESALDAESDAEPAFEPFETIVVAAAAGLRRAPTMERHIQEGDDGARVANWLLTLYRGDRVTATRVEEEEGEEWTWVQAPGDQEGYLKLEWLMDSNEGSAATSLDELRVFEIPDPTRPRPGASIEPGTFLVVVGAEKDFSRVNYGSQRTAWVRTRDLSVDDEEIGASRVISRVRWMKSRNETDGLDALVEGTKEAFPGARLLETLEKVAETD